MGRRFSDRALLEMALTHRSFLNEVEDATLCDNERLEFLGDALVDFFAAEMLYHRYPDWDEGRLTRVRSALVCGPGLARCAKRLALGRYVRLGRGEMATGGRDRSAILANAFEAVVGALYLDQGLESARAFVLPYFGLELDPLLTDPSARDAKSRFQELAQERWHTTPRYLTIDSHGPLHARIFLVEVRVGEVAWGQGEGPSKAIAAQKAAESAVQRALAETRVAG